ncbi:MAG: sigma 54-interacting transcriptional regulator [Bryobacterales bacterium]|nr:sigma 54-interacting transcriptional regulator [Bryobacterales bacterium]
MPRLVGLAGPLQGTTVPIPGEEYSIGREESNALALDDRSVSRRHCVIKLATEGATIRDLGSSNRTQINGIPIDEAPLRHSDEITIGRSRFLFLIDAERPPQLSVAFNSMELSAGNTVLLQRKDALYLHPEQMLESGAAKTAPFLKALLQVSSVVASVADADALLNTLMSTVVEVIPAKRAAILLSNEDGEFEPACRWQRHRRSEEIPLPLSVVRRVTSEMVSVCWNDMLARTDVEQAASIVQARINALLAVPIVIKEDALGVLYLDSTDIAVQFDDDHLQLLTGIAGMVAVPLTNLLRVQRLEREKAALERALRGDYQMVGDAPAMRGVYAFIRKSAPSQATVLIGGESGTGKEMVARAIHYNSPRASRPFLAINCAAITETLLESELFGHERGSFTGASAQKRGKFEEAHTGTIFLDEIGEMAPLLQAKLLRVLQEREFERVGGNRSIKVDIRVIAATNRDLQLEAKAGRFRMDLFYRLNVVSIKMPPLRDRRQDIPLLAQYFLEKHAGLSSRPISGFCPAARSCMMAYDWPGNVRELENAVERAIVLGSTEEILPEDLPDEVAESRLPATAGSDGVRFHETIRDVKRQLVTRAFEQSKGDHGQAAALLGIHPNNLHRLMKTLGLKS